MVVGGCQEESVLTNISIQGLKGLTFLHSCAQIHRDLKPGNFLISHNREVKVADLGIMKQLPSAKGAIQKTNTFVGTATYMSPERIDGKEYSFPADVWAFGLSIMSIALGRLPIDTMGGYWTILHGIRDSEPPQLPLIYPSTGEKVSNEFRDFMNKCLRKNPNERPTCKELLRHPWLSRASAEEFEMDNIQDRV